LVCLIARALESVLRKCVMQTQTAIVDFASLKSNTRRRSVPEAIDHVHKKIRNVRTQLEVICRD
jgi:hypothetical protein